VRYYKTTQPFIRVNFSWLLYDYVSVEKYRLNSKDWGEIPSREQCEVWTENYRQEWAEYEDKILPALTETLGVTFYKQVIDVDVAPGIRAMSDPLILNFMYYPDQFVDSLTHELIHLLLTDNHAYSLKEANQTVRLDEAWTDLFGKHDFDTLVHIPVYALHKYIYLDIMKNPERLERDKYTVKDDEAYAKAWGYVDAHNYLEIITALKNWYVALPRSGKKTP